MNEARALEGSVQRRHFYVVYRRYLIWTASGRKPGTRYLYTGGHRATWRANPTKATQFDKEEDAFKWADRYHANVTHMSEGA